MCRSQRPAINGGHKYTEYTKLQESAGAGNKNQQQSWFDPAMSVSAISLREYLSHPALWASMHPNASPMQGVAAAQPGIRGAVSVPHLLHVGVALGTGFKKLDAKLIGEALPLAEWHHALALIHIALVAHQNLHTPYQGPA